MKRFLSILMVIIVVNVSLQYIAVFAVDPVITKNDVSGTGEDVKTLELKVAQEREKAMQVERTRQELEKSVLQANQALQEAEKTKKELIAKIEEARKTSTLYNKTAQDLRVKVEKMKEEELTKEKQMKELQIEKERANNIASERKMKDRKSVV